MNMYTLFKCLPRDLQWEVLSEFVGTHVVRKGKLIQKIVYSTHNNQLQRLVKNNTYVPVVTAMRVRLVLPWLNRLGPERRHIRFRSYQPVYFVEEDASGETIVCYHKVHDHIDMWRVRFAPERVEDAVVLPPFVKHTYPSYPFTDKKQNKSRI
jgi:hypothetical protein